MAEVAFLAENFRECVAFYRKIGLTELPEGPDRLNFANVGEQLFGVCDKERGFIDGDGGFVKAKLHVAFQIPFEQLDDCVRFLNEKGIRTSSKNEFQNWHGVPRSVSVYFRDPAGNVIELWAPYT